MRPINQVLCVIICAIILIPTQLLARDPQSYRVDVSTPIIERDFAFARKNAFQLGQNKILSLAIKDLVDPFVWKSFQNQLIRKQSQIPKEVIASVKINSEYSADNIFYMVLEETIQLDLLAQSLRKMGFILNDDPYYSVTVIVDQSIQIPIESLRERLALFHLSIATADTIELAGLTEEEKASNQYFEDLFAVYPENNIIYLIESVLDETGDRVSEIRTRIIRKSDLEILSEFSINLAQTEEMDGEDPIQLEDSFILERYLSLFTLQSVKRNSYKRGLQSVFYINVAGLDTPYQRHLFEKKMIQENTGISAYSMTQLSKNSCRYLLQSNATPQSFIDAINQSNAYFEIFIKHRAYNFYDLLAYPIKTKTMRELSLWVPTKDILSKISDALHKNGDPLSEEFGYLSLEASDIPLVVEKEPNNSDITVNNMPYDEFTYGRVSSRADEDVYRLAGATATEDIINQYFEPEAYQWQSDTPESWQENVETLSELSSEEKLMSEEINLEEALLSESDDTKPPSLFDEDFDETPSDLEVSNGDFVEDDTLSDDTDIADSGNDDLFEDSTLSRSNNETDRLTKDNRVDNSSGSIARKERNSETIEFYESTNELISATLIIEWIRIGKTTLSPQLRLYDENFNFINAYTLVGNQDRIEISHVFRNELPKEVFVRILDRIGFIQGETGGFKSYDYIIKYNWQITPPTEFNDISGSDSVSLVE